MPKPDTVSEAIRFLASEGYVDDYRLCEGCGHGAELDVTFAAAATTVDYTFRFEGSSDPGDSAIVVGLTCGPDGHKCVLTSAFGAEADPETTSMLVALAR